MRIKYIFFLCVCTLILGLGLERLHYYQNGCFCPSKLRSTLPSIQQEPSQQVDALLKQNFHFLGKGCTCFVFCGDDGKTILKLFNHNHLKFTSRLFHFPLPPFLDLWRLRTLFVKKCKAARKQQDFFFSSCKLSYTQLTEETGLFYLCLEPNLHFSTPVTLIDTWGFRYSIDLSQTEFALQERAEPFLEYLSKAKRDASTLRAAIDAFLLNIERRCSKGIGDLDSNLQINFGWINGKVVEYDLGAFYKKPSLKDPLQMTKELFFSSYGLQKWLKNHAPEHLDYLLDAIFKRGIKEGTTP